MPDPRTNIQIHSFMSLPVFNQFMAQNNNLIQGKIYNTMRVRGRVSNLIERGKIPEGIGYDYQTVVQQRSSISGSTAWVTLANNSDNNCQTAPAQVNSAFNTLSWNVAMRSFRSEKVCYEDLRRSVDWQTQLGIIQKNMASAIADGWEDSDMDAYFTAAGWKAVIGDGTFTEAAFGSATMPAKPTDVSRGVQGALDIFFERLMIDDFGGVAYAHAGGQPLITAIMSAQQSRNIIKEDPSVRQDFQFADEGKSGAATLLKAWTGDKAYGGYMHCINFKQPRYDWDNPDWVKVPFYEDVECTVGTGVDINPDYTNAAYEDIVLWHPEVVQRMMPNPGAGSAAGATFRSPQWNGDVQWLNVTNLDKDSPEFNPTGNTGSYWAWCQRGYKAAQRRYGAILRVARCAQFTANLCS